MNNLSEEFQNFKVNFDKEIEYYFNQKISEQTSKELKDMYKNIKDYVLNGGKRIRPIILNKINKDFGDNKQILNILLAFEFLHNSSLADDDIIDEHETRRNKPTLPTIYKRKLKNYPKKSNKNNYLALISSNVLRNEGMELIVNSRLSMDLRKECELAYLNIGKSIDLAQMIDLNSRGNLDLSEKEYIYQTTLITANFFASIFRIFAPQKWKSNFYEIGKNLGIAFQLLDDLMDIDSKKQKGRKIGSDIKEGTPTLLYIYLWKRLKKTDKNRFKKIFGKQKLSEVDLKWIASKCENTGVIKEVNRKIKFYVKKANRNLLRIGISKDHWIVRFGDYNLNRSN